jgi:uncharacterized protein YcbK (DUF882 family)
LKDGWAQTDKPPKDKKAKHTEYRIKEVKQANGVTRLVRVPVKSSRNEKGTHQTNKAAQERSGPSKRKIEKFLIDTPQPASRDDPSPLDLKHVNPVLLQQAIKLAKASGEPLAVTSGARSHKDQKILAARGGNLAAPAGTSKHETGDALDIELTPRQRAMMGRFGLGTPVAGDEPHVQLTDPALIRKAQRVARTGTREGQPLTGKEKRVTKRLTKAVANQGGAPTGPLTEGQKTFGAELAKLTGIDPQVLGAWMLQEQSSGPAESYEAANYHNWLNIQPSGVGGSESIDSHDSRFNDPKSAAALSAAFIQGDPNTPGGGASDVLAAQIQALRGLSPGEQAAGIGKSVWGTGDISDTMGLVGSTPTRPIPQGLKQRARDVLGKQETRDILAGPTPEDLKLPGRQDGALRMVRNLVGSKVKGDAGFMGEAAGVHSATGDHYAESAYAQDINDPNGNPAEGEPPYSDETLNTILKNLKKEGFPDVPASGSINETLSYEGTNAAGYRDVLEGYVRKPRTATRTKVSLGL